MKERLEQLKKLLEDMRSDSFTDQYAIADFVKDNKSNYKALNELAEESQFYTKLINQTNQFINRIENVIP